MDNDYRDGQSSVTLLQHCRRLRQESTDAERLLWRLLRNRQLIGVKFRRQHQFGPYILDFYCPERRLAIEVDGGQHAYDGMAARDAARTEYLETRGIRVLRFTNLQVSQEANAVAEAIRGALADS